MKQEEIIEMACQEDEAKKRKSHLKYLEKDKAEKEERENRKSISINLKTKGPYVLANLEEPNVGLEFVPSREHLFMMSTATKFPSSIVYTC